MIYENKCFAFIHVLHLFSSLWKYADAAAFSVCSWIAGAFLFQFHSRYLSPKPKNPSFSWRENFFWSFMYMYPLEFVEKHHHRLLTKRELNSLQLKVS